MLLRRGSSEPKLRSNPYRSVVWCLILATSAIVFWTEPAHAYSWMIRHGYGGCPTCHVEPSGGELLTLYGRMQGDTLLSMQYGGGEGGEAAAEEPDVGALWGAVDTPPNL